MKTSRILGIVFGIILLITGVLYFFPNIAPAFGKSIPVGNPWAILLIIGGGALIFFDVLNGAIDFFQKLLPGKTKDKTEIPYDIHSPNNTRNRSNIIANVKESWIKGVYENNLQTAARIELELQDLPEALARPNLHLRLQATQSRAIPSNTPIRQIFDESGQALLILGDPGSGKTFTMLELVNGLLEVVKPEYHSPIPVVLNLSSWAKERLPLADWIVADLKQQYQLAEKVSRAWLMHEQLTLMLDGLDEVDEKHCDACVKAINTFKEERSCPIVVCSRTKDYDELATRLKLTRAIEIQPLTAKQIDDFLSKPGLQLQAVRETIQSDPELRELATAPLILNVMALAYRGLKKEDLPRLISKEGRRKHLFNTYIRRMFQRRPLTQENSFSLRQALKWLVYLAHQLSQRSQTTFFIENLQMDWHPTLKKSHFKLLNGLVYGLVSGLAVGLVFGLAVGLVFGLTVGLVFGLVFWWVGWLGSELSDQAIRPVDNIVWQRPGRKALLKRLIYGLAVGLIFGLVGGLVSGLGIGLVGGLNIGLGSGLGFGLLIVSVIGLDSPAGKAVIWHSNLRWLLYKSGYFPLKIIPFLEAMTDRLVLRRVGGGYIFLHRILLEHFASLSEDELDALAE